MDLSALLCVVHAKEATVKIQLTSLWKHSMTAAIEGDIYRYVTYLEDVDTPEIDKCMAICVSNIQSIATLLPRGG